MTRKCFWPWALEGMQELGTTVTFCPEWNVAEKGKCLTFFTTLAYYDHFQYWAEKYHYHSLASHAKRMCSNIFCTDPSESGLCEGGADRSIRRDRQVETSLVTGEADTCTTTRGEPQRQGWQKYFLKVHVQKNRWKPVWSQLRQTCTRGWVSGDKVVQSAI